MATQMRSATAAVVEDWTHVLGTEIVQCDSNRRLTGNVKRALHSSGFPALSRVSIYISNGCIVLRGIVPSYHVKQIAQEIAIGGVGLGQVTNLLEVRDPTGSSTHKASAVARWEAR
jgi:osmotically-inducible protein OsmY